MLITGLALNLYFSSLFTISRYWKFCNTQIYIYAGLQVKPVHNESLSHRLFDSRNWNFSTADVESSCQTLFRFTHGQVYSQNEYEWRYLQHLLYQVLEQIVVVYKYAVPPICHRFSKVDINHFCTKDFPYYELKWDREVSEERLSIPLRWSVWSDNVSLRRLLHTM
jgi:hypothetical protein